MLLLGFVTILTISDIQFLGIGKTPVFQRPKSDVEMILLYRKLFGVLFKSDTLFRIFPFLNNVQFIIYFYGLNVLDP